MQSGTKVHLNPNLREKRNAGGKERSERKWYGRGACVTTRLKSSSRTKSDCG